MSHKQKNASGKKVARQLRPFRKGRAEVGERGKVANVLPGKSGCKFVAAVHSRLKTVSGNGITTNKDTSKTTRNEKKV